MIIDQVAGVLTVHLLPGNYSGTPMMLQICQDVIASYLLLPAVNKISDPDFINQKVIKYFWKRGDDSLWTGVEGAEEDFGQGTRIEKDFHPGEVQKHKALEEERQEIVEHLERTDAWASGLGEWRARVQEVDQGVGGGGGVVSLVVYLPGGAGASWLVERSLAEFHSLRHRLQAYFPWVRKLDLPPVTKNIFSKRSDKAASEKAWIQLQRFLDAVLEDELVTGSELVYAFLSPSPDHLKLAPEEAAKKTKFFQLSRMFKPAVGEQGGQEKEKGGKKGKEVNEKAKKEEEEPTTSLPKSPFSSMSEIEMQVKMCFHALTS